VKNGDKKSEIGSFSGENGEFLAHFRSIGRVFTRFNRRVVFCEMRRRPSEAVAAAVNPCEKSALFQKERRNGFP
jgi:hypothetical protein